MVVPLDVQCISSAIIVIHDGHVRHSSALRAENRSPSLPVYVRAWESWGRVVLKIRPRRWYLPIGESMRFDLLRRMESLAGSRPRRRGSLTANLTRIDQPDAAVDPEKL